MNTKQQVLDHLKRNGIADLDQLADKITNSGTKPPPAQPQEWFCNLNYCVYVRPRTKKEE
jgi:hypothetical protein